VTWPTRHKVAECRRLHLLWGVVLLLALGVIWGLMLAGPCWRQEAVSPPVGTGGYLDEGGR
jgi:hypothetical protein